MFRISGDFSKFDAHAIKQMGRNIDLIRYVKFGDDHVLLEQMNTAVAPATGVAATTSPKPPAGKPKHTMGEHREKVDAALTDLYGAVRDHLIGLSDDLQHKVLQFYFAFKRIKNFAYVKTKNTEKKVALYLKADLDTVDLDAGFTGYARKTGPFGSRDFKVTVRSMADLDKAVSRRMIWNRRSDFGAERSGSSGLVYAA